MDNYKALWENRMFLTGLGNTMLLSVTGAPLLWIISFAFALVLQMIQPRGLFFRSASLMPYIAPSSAMLLAWLILFDNGGPINRILLMIGAERVFWLHSAALRFPVILMFVWKNLGFCSVIFLAALQSVPTSLYEYATLEGAGFWTKAHKVALPHILPTGFVVLLLCWINAFGIFKEVYIIAGAYPDLSVYTLQHYMNNMFIRLEFQMVTSAAYTFTIIVIGLFGILFLLQRRVSMSVE
jgi:multiple sugar transport system permease protein